ncbi:MAG: hypothetical protein WCJ61_06115 [Paludibacter sp.]
MLVNSNLGWIEREFNNNESEINKLSLSIRDIRNNLFHGGKFHGNYKADESRNFKLLKNSIIVLDNWLDLNKVVKANFLNAI